MKKSWIISSAATLLTSVFVLSATQTAAFAEDAWIALTPITAPTTDIVVSIAEPPVVEPQAVVDVSKLPATVDLGDAIRIPPDSMTTTTIPETTTTIPETTTTIPETTTTIPKTTTTIPKTTTTVPKTTTTVPNPPEDKDTPEKTAVKAEKVTRKYLPFTGGNSALYYGSGFLALLAGGILLKRAFGKASQV